uniref:Uncharacterized protein TCIL3000_11_8990 n=1 Tax=Trypanosoma congolense (strain IL3000) TaxID=1068625 RepID=G0V1C1_TRYCI|nr:unnamed protein product [Trypanosoma congolense IL3000]
MSGGRPLAHDSSKQLWRHLKSSGEAEWAYTHNPYDDSPNRRKEREKKSLNVCRHYTEGRCNRGSTCRFHHDMRHNIIVTPHSTPKLTSIAPLKGLPTPSPGGSLGSPPNRVSCCLLSPTHFNKSISCHSNMSSPLRVLSASTSTIPLLQLPESLSGANRSGNSAPFGGSHDQPLSDGPAWGTPNASFTTNDFSPMDAFPSTFSPQR